MGMEFLQKAATTVLNKATGTQAKPSTEDEVAQIKKQTAKVQAQYDLASTVDAYTNPPTLQQMRAQREADLEQQARDAGEEARRLHEQEMERIKNERDTATKKAEEESARRKETEMAFQQSQTQMLMEKLSELQTQRKPFDLQLEESLGYAERLAERMGFQKASAAVPGADNPQLQLEILRLQLDAAQRQREWEWKMQQEKRDWDIKLMELQDKREYNKGQLAQQAKRDEGIFNIPQIIGGAAAQALFDRQQEKSGIGQRPAPPQAYQHQAPTGQLATVPCPECKSPIGIAPDTSVATCAMCNAQFQVNRQPGPATEPPIDNQEENA